MKKEAQNARKCIACGKDSTHRITPDLDLHGVSVCEDCADSVREDMLLAILGGEKMVKRFNKKYKILEK